MSILCFFLLSFFLFPFLPSFHHLTSPQLTSLYPVTYAPVQYSRSTIVLLRETTNSRSDGMLLSKRWKNPFEKNSFYYYFLLPPLPPPLLHCFPSIIHPSIYPTRHVGGGGIHTYGRTTSMASISIGVTGVNAQRSSSSSGRGISAAVLVSSWMRCRKKQEGTGKIKQNKTKKGRETIKSVLANQ